LLDYIVEIGDEMGLKSICGDVVSNNAKMLHLCSKRGFKMRPLDDEISVATLDLG
jgi:hypothetical protein